jgi:hypothetical protein
MSTEWLDAKNTSVQLAHHEDDHGQKSDAPVLTIVASWGGDGVAIEGTRDELIDLSLRIASAVLEESDTAERTETEDVTP